MIIIYIINEKMYKLIKKLIIYFTWLFLLNISISYYVTVFCAVYMNSHKYWFYGCLELFSMDSIISLIVTVSGSLIKYYTIKKHIK